MLNVFRKIFIFLVVLGIFWSASKLTAYAQGIEVNIKNIKDTPENYMDKKIVVKGQLRLVGDYWGKHEFVLEDKQGDQIVVIPWVPYEVMISPFEEIQKEAPKTMSYYINKELSITGHVKLNKGDKPNIKRKYYVEVELANELKGE